LCPFADHEHQWTKFRGITKRSSSSPLRESSRSLPVPETEAVALSSPHGNPNGAARRPSRQSAVSEFDVEQTLNTVSLRSSQRSQDRSADPLGLTVVYAPKESPSVDIIFVHGLGGSSRKTWSKNRDPELFWPRTWLPSEPDICTARILTFGYNAHYRSLAPNNILSISDFAKNLLFEMRFGKDDATNDLKIGDVSLSSSTDTGFPLTHIGADYLRGPLLRRSCFQTSKLRSSTKNRRDSQMCALRSQYIPRVSFRIQASLHSLT
jgi:hypothetical protein